MTSKKDIFIKICFTYTYIEHTLMHRHILHQPKLFSNSSSVNIKD